MAGFEPYRLYDSFTEFVASADAGCHSCSVLLSRIGDDRCRDMPGNTPVFIENRPLPMVIPPEILSMQGLQRGMLVEPDLEDEDIEKGMGMTVLAVRGERDPVNPVFNDAERDHAVCPFPFLIQGGSRTFYSRRVEGMSGTGRLCSNRIKVPVEP